MGTVSTCHQPAIKPIETHYKGYRFRSRLEARWAVFFDALGVEWEYEPEGFDLGAAGWYLPDFKVCRGSGHVWFEVKASEQAMTPPEWLKVCRFGEGNHTILLFGPPTDVLTKYRTPTSYYRAALYRPYLERFKFEDDPAAAYASAIHEYETFPGPEVLIPCIGVDWLCAEAKWLPRLAENEWGLGGTPLHEILADEDPALRRYYLGRAQAAIIAARSARFGRGGRG